MIKFYNNFTKNTISKFCTYNNILNNFITICHYMPLTFLNFLPAIITILLKSESIISLDLSTKIAALYSIKVSSAEKKIKRFFENKHYDFIFFYEKFITHIINNYRIKHKDNRVIIAFDHMHIKEKFTILMFSLRIGRTGIPIWFRVFKYSDKEAFTYNLFKNGISYCHNLIKNSNQNSKISFLADRFWGSHVKIFDYIDSLNDNYFIRAKGNILTFVYDKKKKKYVFKPLSQLKSYKYHSVFYKNILVTKKRYKTNLTISCSDGHKEPYYIFSNSNENISVKEYSKRFASIEFIFKNQKSNGFYLEDTQIKNLKSLESLYVCICIAHVLLTMLGIYYSKNKEHLSFLGIRDTKKSNGKNIRSISYFHIGLLIVEYVEETINLFELFERFILYDV